MRIHVHFSCVIVLASVIAASLVAVTIARADDPYMTPGSAMPGVGSASRFSEDRFQETSAIPNAWNTINATVLTVGNNSIDVMTDQGEAFTFAEDGVSNVVSTLSVGDSVAIQLHPLDSGVNRIGTIVFVAAAPPPAAPPAELTSPPAVSQAPPPAPPPAEPAPAQTYTPPAESSEPTVVAELPRTAGGLPLVALIGALSLGAAFGMRLISRSRPRTPPSRIRF